MFQINEPHFALHGSRFNSAFAFAHVNNRGMTHVELPDYFVSSCGGFHPYGAGEPAPRIWFLIHIWHMNGFVVLGL